MTEMLGQSSMVTRGTAEVPDHHIEQGDVPKQQRCKPLKITHFFDFCPFFLLVIIQIIFDTENK